MEVTLNIKQEVSEDVENLKQQLKMKENELREEMDDRDKAEDRVLRLTENLAIKDKELDGLRRDIDELKKASSDVPRLLQAFNNADREKKKLESKVVEMQVALSAARKSAQDNGAGKKKILKIWGSQ